MIQSMTGFGSAEKGAFRIEIRSVNQRYMDISVKMPQGISLHEMQLRNMLKECFSRGRFDVFVSVAGGGYLKAKIDMNLAREIYDALLTMKDELPLSGTVSIETMAGFRDLIITEETEYDAESLFGAFKEAVSRLSEMRVKEGEAVSHDMLSRLTSVDAMKERAAFLCPDAVNLCRDRFIKKLRDLFGDAEYDENRVLQEASIMAEKLDISEEITRLGSHISHMQEILSDGGIIGRKMEFILQEMNREINTIASKSEDYRISSLTIEMKAEIEKMREQAQNIE